MVANFTLLSMEVSDTIFKVFGMTWPEIELRSPGPLANTLPTSRIFYAYKQFYFKQFSLA